MPAFESGTSQILVTLQDRVATITLNRPEARNALSTELSVALRRAIAWAAEEDEVGAVLLTGAGGAFCAGGDVKSMDNRNAAPTSQPTVEAQFREMTARHHEVAGALRKMRKPSVAAIPGPAAGAGLAIALSCDLRVMAKNTFVSTAYARIGLSGDYGVAWLLTRVVGPGRARQLMLTAERVDAEQAFAIGLVNQLADPDELMPDALVLAHTLAHGPAIAFAYIKDNLDEALDIDHATAIDREADRLIKARSTDDHKEAARAFAEKRSPVFTGR